MQYQVSIPTLMDFFCQGEHQGFSEADIQTAEKTIGVALPTIYRDFLKRMASIPSTTDTIISTAHRRELSLLILIFKIPWKIGRRNFRRLRNRARKIVIKTTAILLYGSFHKKSGLQSQIIMSCSGVKIRASGMLAIG